MKRTKKRLQLSQEQIRMLTQDQLGDVQGGGHTDAGACGVRTRTDQTARTCDCAL